MSTRTSSRGASWRVRAAEALALGAWAGLAYVVVALAPERLASRIAFFATLGLALWLTLGLAAYGLSFPLFSDERYRGNFGRALRAGAVAAGVGVIAALLQVSRSLTPLAGAALCGLLLVGQIVVLMRE